VCVLTDIRNREGIEAAVRDGLVAGIEFEFVGVPRAIASIPWRRGLHYIYYIVWQARAFAAARRRHESEHFDLVHHVTYVNSWAPSFMGYLGVPFIWDAGPREKTPLKLVRAMSWRSAGSEVIRNVALELFGSLTWLATGRRARLILSGSPSEKWPKSQAVRRFPLGGLSRQELDFLSRLPHPRGRPFRIASIGRLLGLKGYSLGLQAFAALAREIPDGEYWIIGKGPEGAHLAKLAEKLGCIDRVRFVGWLSRDEVLALLGEVDLLLHPSLHEQFGYAMLEAMAARRPVVALDVGAASMVVGEGCGALIRPAGQHEVVEEIYRALLMFATDRSQLDRMGARAQHWANEMWSWEAVGERVLECYEEIT
jgi:glycosyltransferase involved in cell wall biosynthesis